MKKNPFLERLCEDTRYCLNEPGNPCGISSQERADLVDWHVANCGGRPELVAITLPRRVVPISNETRRLAASLRKTKSPSTTLRKGMALNQALGKQLKKHLGIVRKTTSEVHTLFDRPPKPNQNTSMARKRLVVLREGCTEYYGYYVDETQQCVYIGAGYVEGCEAD